MARSNNSSANRQRLLTWKDVAPTATIMAAVVLAVLGLLGRLFKNSYTPQVIDNAFGITSHVQSRVSKELARNIDSGYSQVFQINQSTIGSKHQTTFYARSGQKVRATVIGQSLKPLTKSPVPVKVYVDREYWTTIWIPEPDSSFRYNGDVTTKLNFSDPQLADIHDVRLVPGDVGPNDEIFVRTLVLVENVLDEQR